MTREDGAKAYVVVVNLEDQYSIWPVGRDLPGDGGWRAPREHGTSACPPSLAIGQTCVR